MFDQRQNDRIRKLQAERASAAQHPRPSAIPAAKNNGITIGYRIVVALIVYPIAVTARQIVDMGADENFSFEQSAHLLPLIYIALGFVIFMFAGGAFSLFTFRKRPRFAWVILMCFVGYFPGGALMKLFL